MLLFFKSSNSSPVNLSHVQSTMTLQTPSGVLFADIPPMEPRRKFFQRTFEAHELRHVHGKLNTLKLRVGRCKLLSKLAIQKPYVGKLAKFVAKFPHGLSSFRCRTSYECKSDLNRGNL